MRTTGLCVNRDPLCEKVNHPLSYYKVKKKDKTGMGSRKADAEKVPSK
jgi:DNA primase large subunit